MNYVDDKKKNAGWDIKHQLLNRQIEMSVSTNTKQHLYIDHEIISMVILLPSRVVVSYKRKYVHKVLVNGLVKLAQLKKCG